MTYFFLMDEDSMVVGVSCDGPFKHVPPGLTADTSDVQPVCGQMYRDGQFHDPQRPAASKDQLTARAFARGRELSHTGVRAVVAHGVAAGDDHETVHAAVTDHRDASAAALSAVLMDVESGKLTTFEEVQDSLHWPQVKT